MGVRAAWRWNSSGRGVWGGLRRVAADVVPVGQDLVAVEGGKDLQGAYRLMRVAGGLVKQPGQPGSEGLNRTVVEQVASVADGRADAVRSAVGPVLLAV